MTANYHLIEPPAGLLDRILSRIALERRLQRAKHRLVVFSIALLISIISFLPAFKLAQTSLRESGFSQFLSLLTTDWSIIMVYWQSFIFSLLESLPVISLAIFVAVIYIFALSLKFLTQDLKNIYQPISN